MLTIKQILYNTMRRCHTWHFTRSLYSYTLHILINEGRLSRVSTTLIYSEDNTNYVHNGKGTLARRFIKHIFYLQLNCTQTTLLPINTLQFTLPVYATERCLNGRSKKFGNFYDFGPSFST